MTPGEQHKNKRAFMVPLVGWCVKGISCSTKNCNNVLDLRDLKRSWKLVFLLPVLLLPVTLTVVFSFVI